MELKPYQQQVINDLASFLDYVQASKNTAEAFYQFWANHPRTPLQPFVGKAIEPYKNNVPGVPHICVKVPTAGGKTFIACNAIKTIFDAYDARKTRAVMWLVPSITILEQTIRNLRNPAHPYRQKINSHFGNKVEVYDKATLLQGSGFNASSVKEQLSIMVFSFDSLRAKNKEDRKVFQENGNLHTFENLLSNKSDITLGAVIKYLNPVVVVDESHNAESELSVDMLREINPSFILDLTATPRKNSNIISFIDSIELKKENMVKLPVIVSNHDDKTTVINSALQLQKRLEANALEEERNGGKYIRPIVLFQAQPKNDNDNTTFEKLKQMLVDLNIPKEQIKIKTANINELKNVDLMSRDCPVRFIITVNALKEGWDCPFAYILASLADKHSPVDVEQILGRVLRQPYVMKHNFQLLNVCYVLTASAKFLDTLNNIVKGLNKAGFSELDYKLANTTETTPAQTNKSPELLLEINYDTPPAQETTAQDDGLSDIDVNRLILPTDTHESMPSNEVLKIELMAQEENTKYEAKVTAITSGNGIIIPTELKESVKTFSIKEIFKDTASQIRLPEFHMKTPDVNILEMFEEKDNTKKLDKEDLLKGFELSKCDTHIAFNNISASMYWVDLDITQKEHTPHFAKLDGALRERIEEYILDPTKKGARTKVLIREIENAIGNMSPIADKEIKKYLERIVDGFSDAQTSEFMNNNYTYSKLIKDKIHALSAQHAQKLFSDWLDSDTIFIKDTYKLPETISPKQTGKPISKSLYEKEGSMNAFEEQVINEIANMPNVAFWTRNLEQNGFKINGFINHYPDFIIHTKGGKTVILETKGDHLEAQPKILLGNLWASKAGNNYRYFLVYQQRNVEGAYNLEDFLKIMKEMK